MATNNHNCAVIDETLIKKCIQKQKQKQGTVAVSRRDFPMEFSAVQYLNFSFLGIARIDNLVGFEQLKKLQLDNNNIVKIENLSHLVSLEWLDLSFNQIEKIEGLDGLTNLQDLSLYNNKISVIEGIDHLVSLRSLSVGNNKIADVTQLPHLSIINFSGNLIPETEYTPHAMAHLPNLKYLDHRRIDSVKRQQAKDRYADSVRVLEENDRIRDQEKLKDTQEKHKMSLLKEANLLGVSNLFNNIIREDNDLNTLRGLPSMEEVLSDYQEKFHVSTEEFKNVMLDHHKARLEERKVFDNACSQVLEDNRAGSTNIISEYARHSKQVFRQVGSKAEKADREREVSQEQAREQLEELAAMNKVTIDDLLELEVQMSEQMEVFIKAYDKKMSDIGSAIVACTQSHFTKIRDLELIIHERVSQAGLADLERFHKNELEVDITETTKLLLSDRDTLPNYINGSHDTQVSHIEALLEEMKKAESATQLRFLTEVRTTEASRNRQRLSEIWMLKEFNASQISNEMSNL